MIQLDAVTNLFSGTAATISSGHTCSGNNRAIFVGINGATTGEGGDIVTTVTYGGSALSLVGKNGPVGGVDRWQYLYSLVNPPSGSNTISVTTSPASYKEAWGVSFQGVKQTGQPYGGTVTTDAGSNTSHSTTIPIVGNNSWLVGHVRASGGALAAGANTVLRLGSNTQVAEGDSNQGLSGNGTLNYTANAGNWISIAAGVAPVPAGGLNLTSNYW